MRIYFNKPGNLNRLDNENDAERPAKKFNNVPIREGQIEYLKRT